MVFCQTGILGSTVVERKHSGIALDPQAAWLSDCRNLLGSVSMLSVPPCSSPDLDADIDEWAGVLYSCTR